MILITVLLCVFYLSLNLSSFCFAEALPWTEDIVSLPNGDHEIPATVCVPSGEGPFPAVVMLHGTYSDRNESNGAYQKAARALAEKHGIASIRIDFMGCGDSKADYRGYTFESAVSDASAAAEYMKAAAHINPERIGVLGWSQGGTDALLCAARRPELFKSVVTWAGAPDLKLDVLITDEQYRTAKEQGFYEVDPAWREPLKVSLQWCEDVLHTDVLGEFAKNFSGPVLAIQGTDDTTVDPLWCGKIAEASNHPASGKLYIDGMDHTFNVFVEEDFHSLYTAIDAAGEFFSRTLK